MEKAIYLITGVMASGKSTVAELLASRLTPAVHLRGDVFRRMIVSGRVDMSANPSPEAVSQLHMRYQLAADAAKTYYANGFSVVLQDNYYGAELPAMLARLSGCTVRLTVLCPSVEAVRLRESSRAKSAYTGFTIENLYSSFLAETPRLGFWLDTTSQSPHQSAAAILEHWETNEGQETTNEG